MTKGDKKEKVMKAAANGDMRPAHYDVGMKMDKFYSFDSVYIPFSEDDEFDWRWEEKAVRIVDRMWRSGYSVPKIAYRMERDPDEVLILLICRLRQDHIKKRPGGLQGTIT